MHLQKNTNKKKIPHKNTGIAVDFFTSQVNKLSWPMRECAIFLHSLSATVAPEKKSKIKIIILLTIFSTFVRDFFDNFFPLLIAAQIDKKKHDEQGENIEQSKKKRKGKSKRRKQLKLREERSRKRADQEPKAKKRFMQRREREGGREAGQWAIRRFDAQWKSQ